MQVFLCTRMSVGKRIESFRKQKELSIKALSEASGVKVPVLEAIEKEEVVPAIGVMVRLARALGQRLGSFMDDQFQEDPLIVRESDRKTRPGMGSSGLPYEYFSLGRGKPDRHIEPFYIVISTNEIETSTHEGEEFIYVLSGQLELHCGKSVNILNPGDSAYYNSLLPHALRAVGTEPAEIIASVFTPLD